MIQHVFVAEFHTHPRSAPMVNVGAQLVKTAGGAQGPRRVHSLDQEVAKWSRFQSGYPLVNGGLMVVNGGLMVFDGDLPSGKLT